MKLTVPNDNLLLMLGCLRMLYFRSPLLLRVYSNVLNSLKLNSLLLVVYWLLSIMDSSLDPTVLLTFSEDFEKSITSMTRAVCLTYLTTLLTYSSSYTFISLEMTYC